jgi:hypothetical protein
MPQGEREYLSRLRCPSGSAPEFKRLGSYGTRTDRSETMTSAEYNKRIAGSMAGLQGTPLRPGDDDYHIVDGYDVSCGETRYKLYMDMYHCPSKPPSRLPPGFTVQE